MLELAFRFGTPGLSALRIRWSQVPLLLLAAIFFLGTIPALAKLQSVAERFGAGKYPEARTLLDAGEEGARPAEGILWQSRLLTSPAQALELLQEARRIGKLPESVQIRIALEIAELESARGRPEEALQALDQIFQGESAALPGAVYLQAGFAYRTIGNLQKAREMLASIRPGDPAFLQGRGTLGEIGLQQDDPVLALRYFQSASASDPGAGEIVLASGLWKALRLTGEHEQADQLVERLRDRHPGSLALLEIDRILRSEREELGARDAAYPGPADSVISRVFDPTGRFCLQLGAFSDRGLALAFQQRFMNQVPDLRIEQVRDSRGQFLYKIRSGSFVNPALASTQAARLERQLGVEVIVADLAN